MSGAAVLEARGLSVELGGRLVLDGVDLAVAAGDLIALVGPNGAGKSTLLAALAGDLRPAAGAVLIEGRVPSSYGARGLARQRAVLTQQQRLAFGFTVAEVVRMGRAPWSRTEQADHDDAVVADALARADVTAFADRSFPTLSGGEQARTAFARALAQAAPVLLLDEPTAALDIRHQEAVLAVARACARAGAAVVVVLHDLSLAAAYADRVCVLADGRLRAEGPPAAVIDAALLSEVYAHPVHVIEVDGSPIVVPVRQEVPCSSV